MEPLGLDLLDLVEESVFLCDLDGRITGWNTASETLYGYKGVAVLGCIANDILKSRFTDPHDEIWANVLRLSRWEGEIERISASGETMTVLARWSVRRNASDDPIGIVETGRNISAQKTSEEALRYSEYRYRNLFQAMAAAFWELDFTAANEMVRGLIRSGVTDLRRHFAKNPNFVREMMRATKVVDVNEQTVTLFGGGDKSGLLGNVEPFWPQESTHVYAESYLQAVQRKPNYSAECKLRRTDGTLFDGIFTVAYPSQELGRGTTMVGVIDISERVRAQEMLQAVQADFAHAARVSMLGELTASIAHEVNQPLGAIVTNGEAGLRWLSRPEPDLVELEELTESMVSDARRAAAIISRVRNLATRRAPEKALVSLNEVVEETLQFLRHEIQTRRVALLLDLAPDLPSLIGDRTQLQQVIVNLAMNAVQAMSQVERADGFISIQTNCFAPDVVSCVVQDNGPGISENHLPRLFESFFTTKESGMGMGLPICRSIIEAHGGTISARNGPHVGACFSFTIPAAATPEHATSV